MGAKPRGGTAATNPSQATACAGKRGRRQAPGARAETYQSRPGGWRTPGWLGRRTQLDYSVLVDQPATPTHTQFQFAMRTRSLGTKVQTPKPHARLSNSKRRRPKARRRFSLVPLGKAEPSCLRTYMRVINQLIKYASSDETDMIVDDLFWRRLRWLKLK
jgi:hypothetical protein